MTNNVLKVYGEDVMNAAINASTIAADKVIAAGSCQGALALYVYAVGAVTTAASATITVKHCDTETGTFTTLTTITIAADKSYADGALIDSVMLPLDTKAYISASAASSSSNSGRIRVTLGYLAR